MQGRKAEDDNIEENLRTSGEQVQSIKIKLYFTCVWFPFPNQISKPIPGFQDRTDHVSSNFNTPSANHASGQTPAIPLKPFLPLAFQNFPPLLPTPSLEQNRAQTQHRRLLTYTTMFIPLQQLQCTEQSLSSYILAVATALRDGLLHTFLPLHFTTPHSSLWAIPLKTFAVFPPFPNANSSLASFCKNFSSHSNNYRHVFASN